MTRTRKKLPDGVRQLPNGRFQARYPVTSNGTTRQVSAGTFGTPTEALDARNQQLAKLRSGAWVDPKDSRMTVRQWSQAWIEARPSTNRTVRSHLNSHILPAWGDTRLEDVTTLGLQHWVNSMNAEGLAPATVRDYYGTFKQMLGQAVVFGKLTSTPCIDRAVKLPAMTETDIVLLTAEQMAMLERVAPPRFRAMIHLAAWTGMRFGELAGVRWQDIDLEAGIVHVQHVLKHDGTWGPPKNGKKRKIAIDAVTVGVLRQHRRDFGNGSMDLLFTTQRQNRPINGSNWRANVWAKMVKTCKLEPAPTFHDLRHGHAGHMVMQGMDWKVLSDRLGHHKPSFTMDRYGWIRPDSHEVTLAALERARASS